MEKKPKKYKHYDPATDSPRHEAMRKAAGGRVQQSWAELEQEYVASRLKDLGYSDEHLMPYFEGQAMPANLFNDVDALKHEFWKNVVLKQGDDDEEPSA